MRTSFTKNTGVFSERTEIAVILQNVLFRSTPKMARTKHTVRKALDGAAMRTVQASKNIAVKAPHKPPRQMQKRRRFRPGTVALREIRRYQKSTDLLIRRAPIPKNCARNCEKLQE